MKRETKVQIELNLIENIHLGNAYSLLKFSGNEVLFSELGIKPGQFIQILPPGNSTLLRRPISICDVDYDRNELWILVRKAGRGTKAIINAVPGTSLNVIMPLGKGFSAPTKSNSKVILIGGGVGVAPLLLLGQELSRSHKVTFLLGARTESDLLLISEFNKHGNVALSTEDGSAGEEGFVTANSVLNEPFDSIYCCGPLPMMKAVAEIAKKRQINCEVSLENNMACGIGACLCCVEDTKDKGNVCVCTDGPVFNIEQLKW